MSIINDALNKTQHIRKMYNENIAATKASVTIEAKPVRKIISKSNTAKSDFISNKKNIKTDLRIKNYLFEIALNKKFWLQRKIIIILTIIALFLIMLVSHHNKKSIKNPVLKTVTSQPQTKARIAFDGVYFAENNAPTAIINKQSLHLGDTLKGMKIIAINQDRIDLQSDKGIIELKAGVTYNL